MVKLIAITPAGAHQLDDPAGLIAYNQIRLGNLLRLAAMEAA